MTAIRTAAAAAATGALLAAGALPAADPAQASIPVCGNNSFLISATPAQGATGHGSFVLLFRNTTTASCSIYGYPGLDALTATGHVLAHATRTRYGFAGGSRHGIQNVTVTAGHYASATVEWMNFNPVTSGACTYSDKIEVTPANTHTAAELPVKVSVCALQVHPTVAGTTGLN